MAKIILKGVGVLLVLLVCVWALLDLTAKPVTREEAQKLAIEALHRSGQQLGFDPSIFHGPEPFSVSGAAYAFQWRFADQEGAVRFIVSVETYGATESTWDGDLERLRKRG